MAEILHSLRQKEFPESTLAAFRHVCSCFTPGDSGIPGLGGEDLAAEIIEDYIFCKLNNKGKPKRLTAIEELQVLEIIVDLYNNTENEIVRHSLFKALFSRSSDSRTEFVCRLISLAVGVQCGRILESCAVWMQIQGCNSGMVTQVVQCLVRDYCTSLPGALATLRALPQLSAHFTCNLLTALTTLYHPPGSKSGKDILPATLLEMVVDWLSADPRLCLVSLCQTQSSYLQPQRTTLWTSPTKPNTQTPIPGLVRWATKSSLMAALASANLNNGMDKARSKLERSVRADSGSDPSDQESEKYRLLWSHLHLTILQTLSTLPTIPGATQLELITLADMSRIVKDVSGIVKLIPGGMEVGEVQTAVERLVQVLQISLATGGFRCSLADLKSICQTIPRNKLLEILESQHLSIAPPQMHNAT